jgi:nucleoside-diphosphate-sugar epimerase
VNSIRIYGTETYVGSFLAEFLLALGFKERMGTTLGHKVLEFECDAILPGVESASEFRVAILCSHPSRRIMSEDKVKYYETAILEVCKIAQLEREFGCTGLIFLGTYWQEPKDMRYKFLNDYATSKEIIQTLLTTISNEKCTFRSLHLFDVYGPGDSRKKLIPNLIQASFRNQVFEIHNPNATIVPLYISDAVEGIWATVLSTISQSKDRSITYSLPGSQRLEVREVVEVVKTLLPRLDTTSKATFEGNYQEIDGTSRYSSPPGWKPKVSLRDGLMLTIDSFA